MKPLILSGDFKYVLDLLENSQESLFLTGRAGTGKSTLLRLFRDTTKKKVVVVAPTGIAALNVGGQTIHSFFGFPGRFLRKEDIHKVKRRKVYEQFEVLVMDEISMVRADVMDAIDWFLRINRGNAEPFGGVQLVMIGDLFQLPPVVSTLEEKQIFSSYYESPFFFSAKVFERDFAYAKHELGKVYRQDNRHFLRLLDAIRSNSMDWEDLQDLNERHLPNFDPGDVHYITISARNFAVDRINQRELSFIDDQSRTYTADIQGQFDPRQYPTEAAMTLKPNAQVMFIKNDPEGNYVNGSLGKVVSLHDEFVRVALTDSKGHASEIDVFPVSWEIIKYEVKKDQPNELVPEVMGTFEQIPLKLAWAVTIHKAQGQTFDRVIIDLDKGAFEAGQTYVALSRCRSLEGIVLKKPLTPQDVIVDDRIVAFYAEQF